MTGRLATFVVMRVTALLLAVLVLGHFALTHLVTDVAETDSSFVIRRWSSALWIAWDSTMLAAALTHAGAGLWLLVDERTTGAVRRRLHTLLATALGVLLAVGTAALVAVVGRVG